MRIENNEIIADLNKAIKTENEELYYERRILLPNETEKDFTEIDLDLAISLNDEIYKEYEINR